MSYMPAVETYRGAHKFYTPTFAILNFWARQKLTTIFRSRAISNTYIFITANLVYSSLETSDPQPHEKSQCAIYISRNGVSDFVFHNLVLILFEKQ